MSDTARSSRWPGLLTGGAALLFLAYASTFLYFFVDDEAITLVYAQHLLRGHGLTYSVFEGPTEGFSNLLHVLVGAALITVTSLAGASKLAVFFLGKTVSLAAGTATVILVGSVARRWFPRDWRAQAGALTVVALAGPLAVWSCSSLETAPFAATFFGYLVALLVDTPASRRAAIALGMATILFRTDGFVYVGTAGAAAWVVGLPSGRRTLWRLAWPVFGFLVAYTAWRWWYFGSVLSLPLQTKVLFKLLPPEGLVRYATDTTYLERFLETYGWLPLVCLAGGWLPFWRAGDDRRPFIVLLTASALVFYVAAVEDWMFGFRFFAALFAPLAVLAGQSLASIGTRSRALATVALAGTVAWSAWSAVQFVGLYERADRLAAWKPWWQERSGDPARYFAPYYPMYQDALGRIQPGAVTINNQAGFLPFMLDLENIDDLGITSRFFATLPTPDVIFTDVGRYHPLTPRPPLRAGEAYLVHRDAAHLVIWRHMIANANGGRVPQTLLGGQYRLAFESRFQVVYDRALPVPALGPDHFLENLAHPASVGFVARQGTPIPREHLNAAVPYLRGGSHRESIESPFALELHLPEGVVHGIWIDRMAASVDAAVTLSLHSAKGVRLFRDHVVLPAGAPVRYDRRFDSPLEGAIVTVTATATASAAAAPQVELADVRLLGQTPRLRDHVIQELFPE
ncbi:MAG: hypothetical protein AB7O32_14765 [Vicinamibacterales bacterium]